MPLIPQEINLGENKEIQSMAKLKDSKRESKKAPKMTPKEKKEAKRAKKDKISSLALS